MSNLVSLCVIRIEMDTETSEPAAGEEGERDARPSQEIIVETYASKAASMPASELRLLPAKEATKGAREGPQGSREGPQGSREGSGAPEGDTEHRDCEEVDFFFGNPLVEVTKGLLHLYKENELTDASTEAPSHTLCLLAVPAAVSCRDLLAFTAACHRDIQHVRILREAAPNSDRYMALLTFRSRGAAFEFRETFGGTAYSSLEPGAVCHAAWVRRVECARGAPPPHTTELPTCPVCLERMDESVEGLLTVQCAHAFHAGCLGAWRDASCPVCRCAQSPDPPAASECSQCVAQQGNSPRAPSQPEYRGSDDTVEGGALWICLICGHIGCGRYQAGHAAQHFRASNHTYALQLGTNRVWDYVGDNFVHRLLQNKTDGKLVAAGGPADPETCCAPAQQEKVDSIQLECAHLLATQLDAQRRHYEEVLAREKAAAVADAEALKEKLQEAEKTRNLLSKKMGGLSAKLSTLQSELAEERMLSAAAARAREELEKRAASGETQVAELREQVRDLAFFVEASSAIEKRQDYEELRGGQTAIPEPPPTNKHGKHSRRKR